jgi:predicted metal-dependent enzyme (double-stranded beta helix superfamily)
MVASLRPPSPLSPTLLHDITAGIAAAESLWRACAHHDPSGRRPVRLMATAEYEVWVIGWTSGQGVELHDHGDSAGALVVVEGELVDLVADRRSGRLRRTIVGAGRVVPLPVGRVHEILNAGPRPATSIHVYSPPLTAMTSYDPMSLEPTITTSVAPATAALPPAVSSLLLHPSTGSAS